MTGLFWPSKAENAEIFVRGAYLVWNPLLRMQCRLCEVLRLQSNKYSPIKHYDFCERSAYKKVANSYFSEWRSRTPTPFRARTNEPLIARQ